jgi:hypothetical protein
VPGFSVGMMSYFMVSACGADSGPWFAIPHMLLS